MAASVHPDGMGTWWNEKRRIVKAQPASAYLYCVHYILPRKMRLFKKEFCNREGSCICLLDLELKPENSELLPPLVRLHP